MSGILGGGKGSGSMKPNTRNDEISTEFSAAITLVRLYNKFNTVFVPLLKCDCHDVD
jgi:hypothetical protein